MRKNGAAWKRGNGNGNGNGTFIKITFYDPKTLTTLF